MATRLTFLCHGPTRTMRIGGFAREGEALDDDGVRKAGHFRIGGARHDRVLSSPAEAARQTARLLGLAATPDPALRDMDAGRWTGLSFEAVQAQDSDAFAAWLRHPETGPPEGESLDAMRSRMAVWLAGQAGRDDHILAITHPMVVRAALSACLDLPLASVLRFDIAPLHIVVLSCNRLWRLRAMGLALDGTGRNAMPR